ncbi:hypothetical protein SAMD00023353_6500420 [Rosellinia necatrix]|uniref:DUF7730 domain-containing protein n=1 Tax=Rosellinia necatrix TaxID=77044 RepID=A0A1W2TSN2_ROSNE|nr:hypothetical protein SAMD00023353_6500420 [Rosellinia necatrix]
MNALQGLFFRRHKRAGDDASKTLAELRRKCDANTLTAAEAQNLLRLAGEAREALTPRETVNLQQALTGKPPPSEWAPKRDPAALRRANAGPASSRRRADTNEMPPAAQARSPLFRLPPELRRQIWAYVVGGRTVYWSTSECYLVQQSDMQEPYWRGVRGLLTVPLLCRKSYQESIDLVYSQNTFGAGFGSSSDAGSIKELFEQMVVDLRPERVASIRSLEIGFHLAEGVTQYYDSHPQAWDISLNIPSPVSYKEWDSVCAAVANMKGLRRLVVVVWASGDRRHEFRAREADMMKIPAGMTGLEKSEFWLPWNVDPSISRELVGEIQGTYIVKRDFEDRTRFGVSVPNYKH